MEFMINSCFRVLQSPPEKELIQAGVYRVLLDDLRQNITCAALIFPEGDAASRPKVGRPSKPLSHRLQAPKKPPQPLVGQLSWFDRDLLLWMHKMEHLIPFSVHPRVIASYVEKKPAEHSAADKLYVARVEKMRLFLDIQHLQESIVVYQGVSGLVRETMARSEISKPNVYKLWSLLLRFGLDQSSLYPGFDRCGAPGVLRPCDPPRDGALPRKKAGRKSPDERLAKLHGEVVEPKQPGMTLKWRALVLAADKKIPVPKPRWKDRHRMIVESAFTSDAKEENGKLVMVPPAIYEYPSPDQVKWLLGNELSKLERLIERTTKRHFESQLRGLRSRSWAGMAGPNHTWAIDSTIGDVFLRSSINPAWIIGRPVVYVVVDVWSTAIVGFYVCLTGPSWSTAAVALFNSTSSPDLFQRVYDYTPMASLYPAPTLPHLLLCDRGEYLSRSHAKTSLELEYNVSFTPPYRGDLKGIVEVLHRIAKDKQYIFLPGAIDYRRKELELRRSHPDQSVLNLRKYVAFLFELFTEYNFIAGRQNRMTADMIAAGVFPSPAGLWRWGNDMGLAYRREVHPDHLIEQFLPQTQARVRRDGVWFSKCDYSHPALDSLNWTATARNLGGWDIGAWHHPATMGSLWTRLPGHPGLSELRISAESRATNEHSLDEWSDALAISALGKKERDHQRLEFSIRTAERIREIVVDAKQMTREAIEKSTGSRPTFTEARLMEVAAGPGVEASENLVRERLHDEAMQAHEDRMASFINALNMDGE